MRPLKTQILVKQAEAKQTTQSGIILGASGQESGNKPAIVVSCGPEVSLVEQGQTVYLRWKEAFPLTYEGEQMALVDEKDVLAILG